MATEDASNEATESQHETLLSVLCTKENWTTDDSTEYTSLAFRENGIGCLTLLNDQPGELLICEFDWEIDSESPQNAKAETIVDTHQKDLEDSLRLRQVAKFYINIKLRHCEPRKQFGFSGRFSIKDSLSRRLKKTAFEQEEYIWVYLEVGNFPPAHDTNPVNGDEFGQTRWGLRLSFPRGSPIPSLDKWNEAYHLMVQSQYWEGQTNWFSRKLHGRSIDGWKFNTG
ncbi:hypothetical protein K504DRAFT_539451 [Pleomassaria siparia CBS 279.74]|uniref:Uncharacterized protein n=1 Tax=Pleomassaria siparia CBS 279.74 TaxID=1314801 RepID=A0A6G1JRH5_9PLEO|nr:hypothetical protein K504DRAFT_539451 [Pleomassaria siparia CBS 279.74]